MNRTICNHIMTMAIAYVVFSAAHSTAQTNLLMDEITVKGTVESPQQESLTVRDVRESAARDIGEALKQVEGVDIVRKGAIANDIVLRGLQKDNINVFLDGVRLHGACPSRMDSPAFHFDFAEVEKIDIVKGPYELSEPGGIGGTVNAVSRTPGPGYNVDIHADYGSFNRVDTAATVSIATNNFDALGGYAYKYSDVPEAGNGKKITDIYPATSPNRYLPGSTDSGAYEINTGWVKLGWNPTRDARSELFYSHQDAENVLYPYLLMDAVYDRTDELNWTYRIKDVSPDVQELGIQIYWDQVAHLMDDSNRASSTNKPRAYSMQTDATTATWGSKLDTALAVGPGTLRVGADYYNRNWDAVNRMAMNGYAKTAMIPDVFTDNLGAFAGYELPLLPDLTLKGGARNDLTWVRAHKATNKPVNDVAYDAMSGNVQLIWKAARNLEIDTGFGSGVRPPDAQELFINSSKQQGNPFLDPTRNNEMDLGIKYADDRSYIKFAVFDSFLQDYITLVPGATPNVRTFDNVRANIWGAEFGGQSVLIGDLFCKGSLSFTEGRNLTDDQPLAEMPPFRGTVALRYDVSRWFVELAENFAAAQDRVDPALDESKTASWVTTDLKAGYVYRAFSVYVGVYNIFDKFYYSSLSYQRDPFASGVKVPEDGRTFLLSVEYRL